MNILKNNLMLKKIMFLLTNVGFIAVAYKFYQQNKITEAIVFAIMALVSINYHWNKCLINKCNDDTEQERMIDTFIGILLSTFLMCKYNNTKDSIIMGTITTMLLAMSKYNENYHFIFHGLYNLAVPYYFYKIANKQ